MGNLVPQKGGTAVAAYDGNPWADAAKGVETGAYLKFNGNDGRWSFGQDDEDLPEGSRVAGDMESLSFGWICWMDGNVEEEVMVPVVDGKPPLEHNLTDHGPYDDDDGWREAASISLVLESYGGDDQDEAVGTPLLWKTSTGGQVRQIKKLSGSYGRVFTQHPGEFPIVELGAESYVPKNKKHGKIKWSPTLKIVGWLTAAELEGIAGGFGGGDDDEDEREEPAPRKAGRSAPAEDEPAPRRGRAAPIEEEEAPAPRRGRAAPVEEEEEAPAPAPRRGRAAAPVEEEEEAPAPAPRRGRAAAPADEDEGDEAAAPTPRGRSAGRRPAPAAEDDGEEEAAPAPRRRQQQSQTDEEDAPAPRRSAGRGAPPANARLRRFD